MKSSVKIRYVLAVYLFIFSLSIILLLSAVALARPGSIFQSVLLGLTTEILGVVLVFLLINRLFLLEDWNISERVGALLEKLELGAVERKIDYLYCRRLRNELVSLATATVQPFKSSVASRPEYSSTTAGYIPRDTRFACIRVKV